MTEPTALARRAQARWAATPLAVRLQLIRRARHLIAEHGLRLAESSAAEALKVGQASRLSRERVSASIPSALPTRAGETPALLCRQLPIAEALTAEVLPLAGACRFLEREAARLLAPRRLTRWTRPLWLTGVGAEVRREPFGVVLIIGPGNYPLLLPGVQLVQALAVGNAVLLKPAPGGAAPARALIELLVQAGLDPDLVALLPDSVEAAQSALAAGVDKVIFTGSAATGEKILAQLAPRLTPSTMELSGCDAVFVRPDADLDLVVKSLRFGLELNAGASCIGPRRVFVPRSLATELEGRLARAFGSPLSLAPGFSPVVSGETTRAASAASPRPDKTVETVLSPTATDTGLKPGAIERDRRIRRLLDDALSRGAHLLSGALPPDGSITLPLILATVPPDAALLREDVFAPVLSLITVRDDEEALAFNAACPYALGATIFSRDEAAARALAARIPAGAVVINDMIAPTADPRLPFGGRARSGFGVTRGAEGLLEMTVPKVITWNRARWRPHLDAAAMGDAELFEAFLQFTYGPWRQRWSALRRLVQAGRQRTARKQEPK